jgi:hypothetical protein
MPIKIKPPLHFTINHRMINTTQNLLNTLHLQKALKKISPHTILTPVISKKLNSMITNTPPNTQAITKSTIHQHFT